MLDDPEPMVRIDEHGDSAIVLLCRVWTKTEDYWDVRYDLLEEVKRRFDEEEIEIPYPQMDVHTPEPAARRTRPKLDTRKRRIKKIPADVVAEPEEKPRRLFGRKKEDEPAAVSAASPEELAEDTGEEKPKE